jgi:uncharacterized protein YhjY with autotransporter beta-barrel domain
VTFISINPSHRTRRTGAAPWARAGGRPCIAAIGGFLLAPLLATGAAAQACNPSATPAPPNVVLPNVNGQTFSPNTTEFSFDLRGIVGCDGGNGGGGQSGGAGMPGQPGGSAVLDVKNVTTIGTSGSANLNIYASAPIVAFGGDGGMGGDTGSVDNSSVEGGWGGNGGAGGSVTGSVDFTIKPLGTMQDGFYVSAAGGYGLDAGSAIDEGGYPKYGGWGGTGGAGGTIKLQAKLNIVFPDKTDTIDQAVTLDGSGGRGGEGGAAFTTPGLLTTTNGGKGGDGGAGGDAELTTSADTVINGQTIGIQVYGRGGSGNFGGNGGPSETDQVGGDGGAGGKGGIAAVNIAGSVSAIYPDDTFRLYPTGVWVDASGGDGGDGGYAGAGLGGKGGAGGLGGAGGVASALVVGSIATQGASDKVAPVGYGLLAQANGGKGGYGAQTASDTGYGGNGGAAGAGGNALVFLGKAAEAAPAKVITEGTHQLGVLSQSVGGGGGSGGSAGFLAKGGAGANGGNGGTAGAALEQGWAITKGNASRAVVVQSIGGGGGVGGSSDDVVIGATLSVGGNGGAGGNGGGASASLDDASVVGSTSTKGGGGVLVQSIGGAGGAGGNASAKGVGLFAMSVGGGSGTGGAGSTALINSAGIVTTYGDHASGLRAQSIGGGGGIAGAAVSTVGGVIPTAAVAVGGGGSMGGTASTVTVGNSGQLTTYGPDAFGISAQSIGGGGGTGGSATATAIDFSPSEDVPAVSISYAAGGSGGSGNTGGAANVTNSGFVITAGHGAMGIKAQSVGGGGGHAGDASAASWTGTTSTDANVAVNFSVALGGSGGTGGTGGNVGIDNSGLLYTVGQDAHAVFAQSIGGGGGTGGAGDSSATSVVDDLSVSMSLAVGGKGGVGGVGGAVTLKNDAAAVISTRGDGSDGVFAQSVGGGGGAAGGGSASTAGGTLSLAFAIGGKGGSGGDGGAVKLENDGMIATIGTDSLGLSAQSVGGGGGRGGKAGATAGGADDDLTLFVGDQIANGFGLSDKPSTEIFDDIFELDDRVQSDVGTIEKLVDHFSGKAPKPGESDDISLSVQAGLALGGDGGAAGHGGTITLTNTGEIMTQGAHADAVIGQSVGGGGGIGGFSVASGASSDDTTPNLSLSAGGKGAAAGNGGDVTVSHSGAVQTFGVGAFGLVAQTVGGGGGRGGASADQNASALSFGVSLGGGGGASGDGGKAEIDLAGSVATTGKHAVGVLAQSVGGGGGLIRTMKTDQQGAQLDTDDDTADVHNIFLDLGVTGASGPQGKGGAATVSLASGTSVTTGGRNAHGVVASSVGGGGGALGGGVINKIHWESSYGAATGDAGAATIALQGATVAVTGPNAAGLWASSIGGGGRVLLTDTKAGATAATPTGQSGNGGAVSVTVDKGSTVSATGGGHAIIAHSIGGGGLSFWDGGGAGPAANGKAWQSAFSLSSLGAGTAGNVDVSVTGNSTVSATGANASAIVAAVAADITQGNDPKSTAKATVEVTSGSTVSNGSLSNATIQLISSLNPSQVTNSGTIKNTTTGGYAIFNGGTSAKIDVQNTGTITGNIATGAGPASIVANGARGVLAPYDTVDLGAGGRLWNAGAVEVSGAGRFGRTALTGDLVQADSGRLVFDLDAVAGKVDHLHVSGAASLGGGFELVPTTLLPGSHEVLSADGGVTLGGVSPAATHLFSFTPSVAGNTVSVATTADFSAEGAGGTSRRSVADHLQRVWDAGGDGFATGFAALAAVGAGDAEAYAGALDTLSGQSVAAVGYARYLGSQAFAQATYSCPRFEDASVVRTESTCGWFRVSGSWLERDATGGDPGFDFDAVTTAIGGQVAIGDGLFVGGALGWESSRLTSDADATTIDGDTYLGALSLKREQGPWTLTGAVDLGWGSYDSTRQIALGTTVAIATGSPDAFNAGFHARAAYEIPRGAWYMEPALDVDLAYVRLDSYTERGAGDFDLAVDETDTVVLTGTPWLKLGRRVDMSGGGLLDAYVSGGLSLSTGEDFDTTARFANAPPGTGDFTTRLDNPNLIGRVSAGLELYATDRVQLRLQYDGSFADGQSTNGGQFRISYFF